MPLAVAIGVFVLLVIAVVIWATTRYLRTAPSVLPPALVARRDQLAARLEEIIAAVPDKPIPDSGELPDHPRAAVIEAKLLAGDASGALAAAEDALADSPGDPRAHVLLARALLHTADLDAAWREVKRARALGAEGPMIDYLEGRAHHLRVVRRESPGGGDAQAATVPSLITPFEMFILQLERQRQRGRDSAALWLPSPVDHSRTLDHDDIVALVTDHFGSYYDSLDRLSAAALAAPAFTDALYHTARVALKAGFIRQGMRLMTELEPLMESSPEKPHYDRDLAELRDEELPATLASPPPPVPPTARRSRSLKVLN